MKNLNILADATIKEALKLLNDCGEKCLLVIDNNHKLKGTLSDGDIRKAILNGKNINSPIKESYNRSPTYYTVGEFSNNDARDIFIQRRFDIIPVVNNHGEIVDALTYDKVFGEKKQPKKLNITVIIMAGGKGTRLEPFTKVLPKPLIPVHDKPIIEHIIDSFVKAGVDDFYLTVNYKSKILKAFIDELNPDYSVRYVEENKPLGTAGSLLSFKNKINKPFIVTNCDILVKILYNDLYDFHEKNGYDITIAASLKNYMIPYGICELDTNGHLSHITEKPEYNMLVNTGLYVLNPDVLDLIPKNKEYHITELIKSINDQGMKVGVYPIDDNVWIDIGEWTEYHKAIEKFNV